MDRVQESIRRLKMVITESSSILRSMWPRSVKNDQNKIEMIFTIFLAKLLCLFLLNPLLCMRILFVENIYKDMNGRQKNVVHELLTFLG